MNIGYRWNKYIDWLDNTSDEGIESFLPRNNKIIGLNIKKARKYKKMTQQNLADELKVTIKTISNYELGIYEIPVYKLRELSKLLKVTIFTMGGFKELEFYQKTISDLDGLKLLMYDVMSKIDEITSEYQN